MTSTDGRGREAATVLGGAGRGAIIGLVLGILLMPALADRLAGGNENGSPGLTLLPMAIAGWGLAGGLIVGSVVGLALAIWRAIRAGAGGPTRTASVPSVAAGWDSEQMRPDR
jgi:hypothetical protein